MRSIRFHIWLLLAAGIISMPVHAAGRQDKELLEIIHQLSKADNYCYNVSITSVMQNDPAKKETQKYVNYASRTQFISYSGSDAAVTFSNNGGMFKADIPNKRIFYTQFTDSTRQQWKKLVDNVSAALIDSVLLGDATIISKSGNKSKTTYRIKYAAQSMMKDMSVVYDNTSHMVGSISYTIVRPLAGAEPGVMVKQTVTMDHYEQGMPQQVKDIVQQSKDIYAYLVKKYPGYTISKL